MYKNIRIIHINTLLITIKYSHTHTHIHNHRNLGQRILTEEMVIIFIFFALYFIVGNVIKKYCIGNLYLYKFIKIIHKT